MAIINIKVPEDIYMKAKMKSVMLKLPLRGYISKLVEEDTKKDPKFSYKKASTKK